MPAKLARDPESDRLRTAVAAESGDEEKLMPETQSLLPRRFSSRAMRGWGVAVIVTLAFLLGALPAGDNAFVRAKSNVTQLVRQSAWKSAP